MSTTPDLHPSDAPSPAPAPPRTRFAAWPLWISLAGALGLFSSQVMDGRIDDSRDFPYPVTAEGLDTLDHMVFRVGGFTGYLTVIVLLIAAGVWRQRVERRHPWSLGAPIVTLGVTASAGALALAYGWKASLGNYLGGGAEAHMYDDAGRYVLYMVHDFGPYFAWVPVLASAIGLALMAFRERLVSRVLGAGAAVMAAGLLVAVGLTGIPGLPALVALGLVITGIWLSVGRSVITREE